jgi:hypothetical protein
MFKAFIDCGIKEGELRKRLSIGNIKENAIVRNTSSLLNDAEFEFP